MKGLYRFIIKPKEDRYANTKKVGDKQLIVNTELQNHKYVSREAIIVETPLAVETELIPGDEVIIHHNVFRRFYDIKGVEKNGSSYFKDGLYFAGADQIYLYKRNGVLKTTKGYYFVKPLTKENIFGEQAEVPLQGILTYTTDLNELDVEVGDIVGFRPTSEFEFNINGERLYRVPEASITLLYGRKRN
jgi:hypothetical protein